MEKSWFSSDSLGVDVECFLLCNTDYKSNHFKSPWAKTIYKSVSFVVFCMYFYIMFYVTLLLCVCVLFYVEPPLHVKTAYHSCLISFVFCKLGKIILIILSEDSIGLCAVNSGCAKDHWEERDDGNSIPKKHLQSFKCKSAEWLQQQTTIIHWKKREREDRKDDKDWVLINLTDSQ